MDAASEAWVYLWSIYGLSITSNYKHMCNRLQHKHTQKKNHKIRQTDRRAEKRHPQRKLYFKIIAQ